MRRPFLVVAVVGSFALVAGACSLTNLDGFTGGVHPTSDGGPSEASTTPFVPSDASSDANMPASEGGTTNGDPYGDAVRADAPTSWWRFEDVVSSQTLHDEMNHHPAEVLAVNGKPITIQWGVPGAVGKAAQIGATAGYFNVGDVFDFAGSSAFTLEAWVKNDTLTSEYEHVFSKRTDATGGGADTGWILFLQKSNRLLDFQFWRSTTVSTTVSATLPATGFHHVVVTATPRDTGVDYAFFLDGGLVATDPNRTTAELDTTANLVLGFGWSGALDEMAIYEHALAPARVMAHYTAAHP